MLSRFGRIASEEVVLHLTTSKWQFSMA